MFLANHNVTAETDRSVIDPYWKEVVYYAKFDNATTQDDAGINTVTTSGTLSLVSGKFGKALSKGSGANYLNIAGANNTQFAFGTGDFTIEFWINFTANYPGSGNYAAFCVNKVINGTSGSPDGGTWISIQGGAVTSTKWRLGFYNGSFTGGLSSDHPSELTPGTWYHFACCRSNGTILGFLDGAMATLGTMSRSIGTSGGTLMGTDYYANEYNYGALFDDVRVTKGIARYTQSFAPPTKSQPTLLIP